MELVGKSFNSYSTVVCYGYNFKNTNRTFQMQFSLRDLKQDVLCISVFDQDMYSPNGALK